MTTTLNPPFGYRADEHGSNTTLNPSFGYRVYQQGSDTPATTLNPPFGYGIVQHGSGTATVPTAIGRATPISQGRPVERAARVADRAA